MRLRTVARYSLILLPLLVCAGRIHANRARNPQGTTQDVNRYLTAVRVAASRRRNEKVREDQLLAVSSDRSSQN